MAEKFTPSLEETQAIVNKPEQKQIGTQKAFKGESSLVEDSEFQLQGQEKKAHGTPHERLHALAKGVSGEDITQGEKLADEFKTVIRPTLMDALVFMRRIGAIPKVNSLPQALTQRIESIVRSWDSNNLQTDTSIGLLISNISRQVDRAKEQELFDEEDTNTLKLKSTIRKNPPLAYPLEATYTLDDLQERFPEGYDIQQQLGKDAKINVFIHTSTDTSGLMYTVEHEDGKKQALRIVDSSRPFEEVSQDISQLPDVIPSTQVLKLPNGRIAILTDWVEGRTPSSQEEIDLCKNVVDGLKVIPWEKVNPNTPYDLNRTNLRIAKADNATSRVYYIDGDLAEVVVKHGLSSDVPQARVSLLERGKDKI